MKLATQAGQRTIIFPESQFGPGVIKDLQRLLGGTIARKAKGTSPGLDLHVPSENGGDELIIQYNRKSPLGNMPRVIGSSLTSKVAQGPYTQVSFRDISKVAPLWTALQAYRAKAAQDQSPNTSVRVEVPGVRAAQEYNGRYDRASQDVHALAMQEMNELRRAYEAGEMSLDSLVSAQDALIDRADKDSEAVLRRRLSITVLTAVASEDAPSERRLRNALAYMETGDTSVIDSSLHDPWHQDETPAENASVFQVSGAPDLPTAARWIHDAYEPLSVRPGDEDADRTVAAVFGASSIEQLRVGWYGGMEQSSPFRAAEFVLRALTAPGQMR